MASSAHAKELFYQPTEQTKTRSSADAEISRRASHWMPPKCKTPYFFTFYCLPQ